MVPPSWPTPLVSPHFLTPPSPPAPFCVLPHHPPSSLASVPSTGKGVRARDLPLSGGFICVNPGDELGLWVSRARPLLAPRASPPSCWVTLWSSPSPPHCSSCSCSFFLEMDGSGCQRFKCPVRMERRKGIE